MWYDINRTLSHNCLMNFVVGNRGCGKTYAAKRWAIKDFLNNGNQFVYLRRYDSELKSLSTFFRDISQEFPYEEFKVDGRQFIINDEVAGYAVALSNAAVKKSVSYQDVNKIIFDEFIIDKGYLRYLPNEVTSFLDFYETVARMRENVIAMCLSNSISVINPYFLYFDLSLPYGKNVFKRNDILLELVANQEFIEAKKQTRFGKLIEGTQYADYAIENKFLRDNNQFIKKRGPKSWPYFNFVWNGEEFGVWADSKGDLYVTEDVTKDVRSYTISKEDHREGLTFTNFRQSYYYRNLAQAFSMGTLYFVNQNCKKSTMEMFSKVMR